MSPEFVSSQRRWPVKEAGTLAVNSAAPLMVPVRGTKGEIDMVIEVARRSFMIGEEFYEAPAQF